MKKIILWIFGIIVVLVVLIIGVVIVVEMNPAFFASDGMMQNDFNTTGYGYAGMPAPSPSKMMREVMPVAPMGGVASDSFSTTQTVDRIVIRSANMAIVARDVQKAVDALRTYAESNEGFVVNADVRRDDGDPPSAGVSFRIPAAKLDATVAFVRSQSVRVTSESITGEDVTEEYVDVTAKLKNLQASESQFLTILKGAQKTEDVLAVQRELERVRGEIDQYTGRKQYLDNSAKLSAVSVSIVTDEASVPVVETNNEWRPVIVAKNAVAAFIELVKFLGNVAIWIVIFTPVWGTIWLIARIARRKVAAPVVKEKRK
ncbi:MAG: DUF4349 domain-containing protein [Candidatus Peregrinibacteria bacterium]